MVTDDQDSPHLLAPCPREVYWGHAAGTKRHDSENIATLDQADGRRRRAPHDRALREGARHGLTMSDMGAYNEAAAERHFKSLFALLQRANLSRGESCGGRNRAARGE